MAVDASGSGRTGTVNGATWTTGYIAKGLSLDGVNDYVSVNHDAGLNAYPLTIAAWFRTTSTSGVRGLVNKYAAGSFNGYQIFLSNGNLCAWYLRDQSNYVYDGSACSFNLAGFNNGQWHQVVLVVDASGGRLYVDKVLRGTLPWTGAAGGVTTTQALRIGDYPGVTSAEYFQGDVDQTRVYRTALTAAGVSALFDADVSQSTPVPVPTPTPTPVPTPTPTPVPTPTPTPVPTPTPTPTPSPTPAPNATLTITGPTTVAAGTQVSVTVANGPANLLDFVGLHAASAPDLDHFDWKYLSGTRTAPPTGLTMATLTFKMPGTPGPYVFRLFNNGTYAKLATSAVVTVRPPTLTLSKTTAEAGSTIRVTVTDGPGNPLDRLGLHASTGPDDPPLDWDYLNGRRRPPLTGRTTASLTFRVPTTPGSYEFRFFMNGTYTKVATSAVFVVP